jgi:hypothetical protein
MQNKFNSDHHVSTSVNPYLKNETCEEITLEKAFPYDFKQVPCLDENGEQLTYEIGNSSILGSSKNIKSVKYNYLKCTDTNKPVGVPIGESYNYLTNKRFWEIFQNSVGGTGAQVEAAGTFGSRTKRYITVKVDSDMSEFYIGDRTFKNRFSLLDSINKTSSLWAVSSSICVVCTNSFNAALSDKSGLFRFNVRHSRNMIEKIEELEKGIDMFIGITAKFKHALNQANSIPVASEDAKPLFVGSLMKGKKEISTRTENIANRLETLFHKGKGNKGETILDAFSAVTDFYSHESSGGTENQKSRLKQYESSEIGAGNRFKQEFFNTLFDNPQDKLPTYNSDRVKETIKEGKRALANRELVLSN